MRLHTGTEAPPGVTPRIIVYVQVRVLALRHPADCQRGHVDQAPSDHLVDGALPGCRCCDERNASGASSPPASGAADVKHIVIIVEQNHTYDSYFGAYPGADGVCPRCPRVEPSIHGTGVVSEPIRARDFIRYRPKKGNTALSNTTGAALTTYHGGAMDSFVRTQQRPRQPAQLPLLHADGSSAPPPGCGDWRSPMCCSTATSRRYLAGVSRTWSACSQARRRATPAQETSKT